METNDIDNLFRWYITQKNAGISDSEIYDSLDFEDNSFESIMKQQSYSYYGQIPKNFNLRARFMSLYMSLTPSNKCNFIKFLFSQEESIVDHFMQLPYPVGDGATTPYLELVLICSQVFARGTSGPGSVVLKEFLNRTSYLNEYSILENHDLVVEILQNIGCDSISGIIAFTQDSSGIIIESSIKSDWGVWWKLLVTIEDIIRHNKGVHQIKDTGIYNYEIAFKDKIEVSIVAQNKIPMSVFKALDNSVKKSSIDQLRQSARDSILGDKIDIREFILNTYQLFEQIDVDREKEPIWDNYSKRVKGTEKLIFSLDTFRNLVIHKGTLSGEGLVEQIIELLSFLIQGNHNVIEELADDILFIHSLFAVEVISREKLVQTLKKHVFKPIENSVITIKDKKNEVLFREWLNKYTLSKCNTEEYPLNHLYKKLFTANISRLTSLIPSRYSRRGS